MTDGSRWMCLHDSSKTTSSPLVSPIKRFRSLKFLVDHLAAHRDKLEQEQYELIMKTLLLDTEVGAALKALQNPDPNGANAKIPEEIDPQLPSIHNITKIKQKQPSYDSALVWIPAEHTKIHIEQIRSNYDKGYPRWMPHVTLIYPFISVEHFPEIQEEIRHALEKIPKFIVGLSKEEFGFFAMKKKQSDSTINREAIMYLRPVEYEGAVSSLHQIYEALKRVFPQFLKKKASKFIPHLTLGQCGREEVGNLIPDLLDDFPDFPDLSIDNLSLIFRSNPDQPYQIYSSIPLGSALDEKEDMDNLDIFASMISKAAEYNIITDIQSNTIMKILNQVDIVDIKELEEKEGFVFADVDPEELIEEELEDIGDDFDIEILEEEPGENIEYNIPTFSKSIGEHEDVFIRLRAVCESSIFENDIKNEEKSFETEVFIEVKENYPVESPRVWFGHSNGLRIVDLLRIQNLVNVVARVSRNPDGKGMIIHILDCIQDSLDELASSHRKMIKKSSRDLIPFFPLDNRLDTLQMLNSSETMPISLKNLDEIMVKLTKNAIESKRKENRYLVTQIENVVAPETLRKFCDKVFSYFKELETCYAPTMVFYGPNYEANIPIFSEDQMHYTKNTGFYNSKLSCSPTFSHEKQYAYCDASGKMQIFVCLVALGKCRELVSKDFHHDYRAPEICSCLYCYPGLGNFDSSISLNRVQYTLGSTDQILPVLLVTFRTIPRDANHNDFPLLRRIANQPPPEGVQIKKPQARRRKREKRSMCHLACGLKFYPMAKNLHICALSPKEIEELDINYRITLTGSLTTKIHLVFILDRSKSMGKTFKQMLLPTCQEIYHTMRPASCGAVFFGTTMLTFGFDRIKNSNFFSQDRIASMKLEKKTNLLSGFSRALDMALNKWESLKGDDADAAYKEVERIERLRLKAEEMFQKAQEARNVFYDKVDEEHDIDERVRLQLEFRRIKIENRRLQRLYDKATTRLSEYQNHQFVFVLISDGNDNINNQEKINKTLQDYSIHVRNLEMNAVFKVVGIGRSADTQLGMKMKFAVQRVVAREETPYFYARKKKQLIPTLRKLTKELEALGKSATFRFALDHSYRNIEDGFVTNLRSLNPSISADLYVGSQNKLYIIYKGFHLPPHIFVNYKRIPVYSVDDLLRNREALIVYYSRRKKQLKNNFPSLIPEVNLEADQLDILNSIFSWIKDLKSGAVAGLDIMPSLEFVNQLLQSMKDKTLSFDMLRGLSVTERLKLMKEKRGLLSDLKFLRNEVLDIIYFTKTSPSSDKAAVWLSKTSNMKYGRRALRRALKNQFSANEVLDGLFLMNPGEFKEAKNEMRSKTSSLTIIEHLNFDVSVTRELYDSSEFSMTDLLYCVGIVGLGIRTRRSEASNVNPWMLSIDYVSYDCFDSMTMMCGLDAGIEIYDTENEIISDVLLTINPTNPDPYISFYRQKRLTCKEALLHNYFLVGPKTKPIANWESSYELYVRKSKKRQREDSRQSVQSNERRDRKQSRRSNRGDRWDGRSQRDRGYDSHRGRSRDYDNASRRSGSRGPRKRDERREYSNRHRTRG